MAWVRGGWRETRARAGEEWNQDSIQRRKEISKVRSGSKGGSLNSMKRRENKQTGKRDIIRTGKRERK